MAIDESSVRNGEQPANYPSEPETRSDRDFYRVTGREPNAFGEEYNVHAAFAPFACRAYDALVMVGTVGRVIEALPATAQHVTRRRVSKHYPDAELTMGESKRIPADFFLVHGAYPCEELSASSSSQHEHFANPRYLDQDTLESVTDRDERVEWLDRYASLGVVDLMKVCPHFGLRSRNSIGSWCQRNDYEWADKKLAGKTTMARTWKLTHAWGHTYREIAEAYGVTVSIVQDTLKRHADDFEPPEDPSRDA